MTALQLKANNLNNTLGVALLLFGALLSGIHLVSATEQVSGLWTAYGAEALGLLPATGLAAARLLQNVTLDPAGVAYAALQFLLSCWPVAALLVGAILLRRNFALALTTESAEAYASSCGRNSSMREGQS